MMSSTTILTAGSVIVSGEGDASLHLRESQSWFRQDSGKDGPVPDALVSGASAPEVLLLQSQFDLHTF